MKSTDCIGKVSEYRLLIGLVRFSFILKVIFLLLTVRTLSESDVKAQAMFIAEKKESPFVYDETPVRVIVEGYKNFYIYVLYSEKGLIYVNIEDLFNTLKIPCIRHKGDSISGFIENENRPYLIDFPAKQIKVGDKIFNCKSELMKEMGTIYLESSLFAEVFRINLTFSYKSQSLLLKSIFELPVIKQQRIEKMRSNMLKFKGEEIADTVVQRNYHLFKPGMLDWSVASDQTWNRSTDNRFSLGVGSELLYGEADLSVSYYNQQKFDKRWLQYLWRWVDNDNRIIKQAQVGMIPFRTISFIDAPIVGAVVRNSPTTLRKAMGFYTISEFTEPNWTVELYINDVLVGYTTADASGSYMFKVPNVYGYTILKLKFYGPMGEERTEERTRNVLYTILPAGELEYSLSAGILEDSISSRFGQAELNWGVNHYLTVTGGLEYLSSIPNGPFIPYAKATIQPFRKLTLFGEYAHGVRTKGLLDYYFWKDALFEIDYTKYVEGQLAVPFVSLEQRKANLSIPFRYKKIGGYIKLDFTQQVYKAFFYNQANIMFSAYYKLFSANSSTHLNWIDQKTPYVSSDLALSCRLNKGYTLRTLAQYNVSENTLMLCNLSIEKRILKGCLTATYERNVLLNDNYFSISFHYDLPFARTNVSASYSNGRATLYEGAQGSMAFGGGNNAIHTSNNSSVGKGGILLFPFLDLNNNGIFDEGEPMVKLTGIRINGGRAVFGQKDSIVRIPDLNAFVSYIVEFSDHDLETIFWRFKNKIYSVLIDPNQFKRIDIPIIIIGGVSGMAYLNSDNGLKGIGRITVKFYKKNSDKAVAETLSESDGYIDYMGLEPGDYVARIDSVQLYNLGYTADPPQRDFTIKTLKEGDIAGGIDFVLRSEAKQP